MQEISSSNILNLKGQESHLGNLYHNFDTGRKSLSTLKDYSFFDTLELDLSESIDAFKGHGHKSSYSKLKEFYQADCLWLFKNYAKVPTAETGVQLIEKPSKEGIMGTLIQRLMEVFINHRIYSNSSMKTMDDINAWAKDSVERLFDLIVFDPSRIQPSTQRWFVRKDGGAPDLAQALKEGLGLEWKAGNKPIFADKEKLFEEFSLEDYLKKILESFNTGIRSFHSGQFNPDKMISEVFISYRPRGGAEMAGGVDFLYSPKSTNLKNIRELTNGYKLVDGKFNVATWTDPWQLYFYTSVIQLLYKVYPSEVSFLNWNTGKFSPWEVPSNSTQILFEAIELMNKVTIETAKQTQFYVGSNPTASSIFPNVKLKPGYSNCRFCKISKVCPVSKFNEKNEKEQQDKAILKNKLSNLMDSQGKDGVLEFSF